MKFLLKKDFSSFIRLLRKNYEVVAPVPTDDGIIFSKINGSYALPDYVNTVYSVKSILFPAEETLFDYDKNIRPVIKAKKIAVLGIRRCDLNAITVMDRIFEKDPYYQKKRNNTLLIGLECKKTDEYCFCDSFKEEFKSKNYDIMLAEEDDGFLAESGTKKGEIMLSDRIFRKTKKIPSETKLEFSRNIDLKKPVKDSRVVWLTNGDRCFSCSMCTAVCPTCHCFDINDLVNPDLKSGRRVRTWSFCHLGDFTKTAGFTFRSSRQDRLRQFVFDKMIYFLDHYGIIGCTGCGRCIRVCPTGIDITKIYNEITRDNE